MKVLVFGAAGRTGKAVVERASAAGHEVTAFVRGSLEDFALQVRVARGDATLRTDVDSAMRGQEAVIDTIGGKTPWQATALERSVAATVIASMQENRVRRLLVTSMLGIGDSREHAPVLVRFLVATFLRGAEKDKTAMEAAVESSELDWTIVRPAVLTDDAASGNLRVLQKGTKERAHPITRADLAIFLVDQMVGREYLHRAITVAKK